MKPEKPRGAGGKNRAGEGGRAESGSSNAGLAKGDQNLLSRISMDQAKWWLLMRWRQPCRTDRSLDLDPDILSCKLKFGSLWVLLGRCWISKNMHNSMRDSKLPFPTGFESKVEKLLLLLQTFHRRYLLPNIFCGTPVLCVLCLLFLEYVSPLTHEVSQSSLTISTSIYHLSG